MNSSGGRRWKRASPLPRDRPQMSSFFEFSPDFVAVYDLRGMLLYSNAARRELFGLQGNEGIGLHYSAVLEPAAVAETKAAFSRVSRGETATTSGYFKRRVGGGVYFEATLFAYVVSGVQQGVIVVSRDVGALRTAAAENELQAKRISALYQIASAHGRSTDHQMRDAIALAAEHFNCEIGIVSGVVHDKVYIMATFGNPANREVGSSLDLDDSLSGSIIAHEGVWTVDDLLESDSRGRAVNAATGLRSVVGLSIEVDGEIFGTFLVADTKPRVVPLREIDLDFVRVVAALFGTMIERSRQERKLDALAFFDGLTGLANRALVHDKLDRLIAGAETTEPFAVHFIDLDKFKCVNDLGGHNAGDEVLRIVAARLKHCVRESDTVARLGGDEFVIIQRGAGDPAVASALARRVIAALERPYAVEGQVYSLGCSVGISFYPEDGTDSSALLDRADRAMYHAKATARLEFANGTESAASV